MKIKRKILPLILLLGICQAKADEFKVLFVNDASLKFIQGINHGKKVEVGDKFSKAEDILWEKEKQAIKAVNMKSMKQSLFVGKNWVKKSGIDALIHHRRLSTHDSFDELHKEMPLYEILPKIFEDQYDLLDSLEIEANVPLSDTCYFQVTYEYGDTKLTKKLMHERQTIIIDKSLFLVDDEALEPRDIILTIDYVDERTGIIIFVKDNIELTVYPNELE